jgi:phosphate-selective porin OprO and OprP
VSLAFSQLEGAQFVEKIAGLLEQNSSADREYPILKVRTADNPQSFPSLNFSRESSHLAGFRRALMIQVNPKNLAGRSLPSRRVLRLVTIAVLLTVGLAASGYAQSSTVSGGAPCEVVTPTAPDAAGTASLPAAPFALPMPPAPVSPSVQEPAWTPDAGGSADGPRSFPLEASWTDGLQLESPNKQFHLHLGGIGQIDSVWPIGPSSAFNNAGGSTSTVQNSSATLLRRAILQADGEIYGRFDFSIQFDFANASNDNDGEQAPTFGNLTTSPTPLNVWLQMRDVPFFGYVRVGNQSKPIGMENNTAASNLPFMERSDNEDAFYGPFDNGFSLGITAWNWLPSERATWRYGIFRPATNEFGVALNKYTIGARVTALPWYEDDGRQLVHIGLGYWGGEVVQDELRDRARILLRNAPGFTVPILVDTMEVPGSQQYTIGPELAIVRGPLTIQAEYAVQFFTDATPSGFGNEGTVVYHGGYVEALYFLTGEYQRYDKRAGVFDRVIPLHDFSWRGGDCCHSCGAWQAGARFGWLDLNDKDVQGGVVYDWTLGLNWYWNPNMKCQFNWIAEHHDAPGVTPGWINGAGVRVAFDF